MESESMENCPKCHNLLKTGPSYTTTEDGIDYTNVPLYCFNKTCENFVGDHKDADGNIMLDELKKIDVVKNQVN
jgi:hypothetical protein